MEFQEWKSLMAAYYNIVKPKEISKTRNCPPLAKGFSLTEHLKSYNLMLTRSWHYWSFRTSQSAHTIAQRWPRHAVSRNAGMTEDRLSNCSLIHFLYDKEHKVRKYSFERKRERTFKIFFIIYLFLNHSCAFQSQGKRIPSWRRTGMPLCFFPLLLAWTLQHELLRGPVSFCCIQQMALQ